jgi:leader peptidase (prepilin peptidase)/N-methyltransferase
MILESLQSSLVMFTGTTAVLGLLVGSFLNVAIYRLPKMMEREWREQCSAMTGGEALHSEAPYNLVIPRSTCPACGHPVGAWENIPLLSWLILRGRCAHCRAPISPRYPIVEALTGLLSGFIAWHFGYGAAALAALLFTWALIALMFIDLDTQLLPDSITQPLLWAGLLLNFNGLFTNLDSALVGAVAGYLVLWSIYWLFKLIAKKEGMGYGDFKLLAAIGAWLGWQMLPLVILLSSLVGAVVGISLILFAGHGRQVPIPFGPYLAGGGLIALLWGKQITQAYLGS